MSIDPFKGLEQLYKTISKRHLKVQAAYPAEMNGIKGFLGISRGVYARVWFDTEEDSKTLFSSLSNQKAQERFQELRAKYCK
ncbi:MAG TPA: hypothetical protein VF723_04975 [Pyrinomonadaceae bacterium]|jgi:hypothetical protein